MTLRDRAWISVSKFLAEREGRPAHKAAVFRAILDTTGKTWCACLTPEWNLLINRFGGGE